MPIRFPRMHIAQSVTNRLLNVVDELRGQKIIDIPDVPSQPEVPQGTEVEGAAINSALTTPAPELAAPPQAPELPGAVARGEDLIAGA